MIDRLIPAWAGKTPPRAQTVNLTPAHPRVGGENATREYASACQLGSSPRGRGKHDLLPSLWERNGLIPAWAGKTFDERPRFGETAAHPRVGGENL